MPPLIHSALKASTAETSASDGFPFFFPEIEKPSRAPARPMFLCSYCWGDTQSGLEARSVRVDLTFGEPGEFGEPRNTRARLESGIAVEGEDAEDETRRPGGFAPLERDHRYSLWVPRPHCRPA